MDTVWRVDAHQHFWRFDPAAYGWIGDDMAVLKRDFLPAELRFELDIRHIGGSVAVQARASEAETDFLLGLAAANPWILGSWAGSIFGPAIWKPGLRLGPRPPCSRDTAIRCRTSRLLRRFWKMGGSTVAWKRSSGGARSTRSWSTRKICPPPLPSAGGTIWGRSCWITSASRMSGMRARRSGPGASPRSRRRSM